MSTLGRISPFSLLFYSNEGTEPPHAFSLASQGRPWRNTAGARLTSWTRISFEVATNRVLPQGVRCLAGPVREQARVAYRRFQEGPNHPGLRFKRVHPSDPVYWVRVGLGYRAVGVLENDVMVWFWIGSHADYEDLLPRC